MINKSFERKRFALGASQLPRWLPRWNPGSLLVWEAKDYMLAINSQQSVPRL